MKNKAEQNSIHPHIGMLLAAFMKQNKKSMAALSRKIDLTPGYLLRIKKRENCQIHLLMDISHAYKHNLIADIAALLPPEYSGALQNILSEKQKEIDAVKAELAAMTKERDIYKDLLKK